MMVAFSSASAAVRCAVSMQQLIERRYRRSEPKLQVRIGLGVGESTVQDASTSRMARASPFYGGRVRRSCRAWGRRRAGRGGAPRSTPFAGARRARSRGRLRLLESRRDVHGVAGRERASLARPSDHDLARVHPDPQREAVREELVQTLEHPERRLQRPLGVVLLGHRGAEDRDDRVADELLHRPAAERDLGFHRVVEALEEVSRVLGIELGTHRRRADEIGEQDRRQLPLHRSRTALLYGPSRDGSAF